MSNFIWGDLQKSLDDNETIEQAIARVVAEHEADPAAHQGEGESLQNHKANEILDHPAGSVKNDKWSFDIFDYQTYFTDFSNWYKTSGWGLDNGNVAFFQTDTGNGNFYLVNELGGGFIKMNDIYSKYFGVEASLICSDWNVSQKFRFGIGDSSLTSKWFVGFQVEGNKMYAVAPKTDNTQYKYEILNYNPIGDAKRSYFLIYDASEGVIRWYINNQLVHEAIKSQTLVSTEVDPILVFSAALVSLGSGNPEFYFFNPRFSVDYTY